MSLTLLFVFVFVFLAAIDQFSGLELLYQPLVVGIVLGYLFNSLESGTRIGILLQVMTLGHVPVGGLQPPNRFLFALGSVLMGIILFPSSPEVGIVFAFPLAWMGKKLNLALFKLNNYGMDIIESSLTKGSYSSLSYVPLLASMGMGISYVVLTIFLYFSLYAVRPYVCISEPYLKIMSQSTYLWVLFGLASLFVHLKSKKGTVFFILAFVLTMVLNYWFSLTLSSLFSLILVWGISRTKTSSHHEVEEGI